jgi:hypothetical protein
VTELLLMAAQMLLCCVVWLGLAAAALWVMFKAKGVA